MSSQRNRRKPAIPRTDRQADGSAVTRWEPWNKAMAAAGPDVKALIEHVRLHNDWILTESDRAVAVLGPAHIDALLEDLLRSFLVAGKSADRLLDSDRALGTFSARADASHSLGLISDDGYADLRVINRIRNKFAHQVDLHSFEEPSIIQDLQSLRRAPKMDSAREVFTMRVAALVEEIADAMRAVESRTTPAPRA